jgi:mRNA interferase RelE/StbE
MYEVKLNPSAKRDLEKLARRISEGDFDHLETAILHLMVMPKPPGCRKIKGMENSFRIRVGKYRIIYEIYDMESLVLIIRISRRNESTYDL